MNHSPISNRIGAVFLHVSDMQKSIQYGSGLILDSFETKTLAESYTFVKEKDIEILSEIEVHEDGNVLMVCEDKRK